MIEELYINGNYIELSEESTVGVTFQANDISSLSNRQGDYTNEFKVPKTKNNQIALEQSSGLNSSSLLPYQKNTCRYAQNGIDIINNGFATISSFDGFYKIKVISGNLNPFDLIGEKMLSDLDVIVINNPYYFTDNYYSAGFVGFSGIGVSGYIVGDSVKIVQDPGALNPQYNTTATITSIIPSGGDEIIVTDIPWGSNSPPNPGVMTLASNALHSVDWTLENVVALNQNDSGVIFPIIDYNGASVGTREIDVRRLLPAVWARSIFDYIFSPTGFTYTGDFKDEEFADLIIPVSTDNAYEDFEIEISASVDKVTTMTPLCYVDIGVLNTKTLDVNNNWRYGELLSIQLGGINNGWQFVADVTSDYTFDISLPYISIAVGSTIQVLLSKPYLFNGQWLPSLPGFPSHPSSLDWYITPGTSGTLTGNVTVHLEAGERIALIAYNGDYTQNVEFTSLSELNVTRNQVTGHVVFGQPFPIADNLPKMKQVDFVKLICQKYNLSFITDSYSKNVHFYPFSEIIDNKPIAKDWSNKLDVDQPFVIEYKIGNYAQSNVFKYKEDESVNGGVLQYSGLLFVNNETLPTSSVAVQSIFGETEMTIKLDGLNVPYVNKYNDDNSTFDLSVEPRLFYIDKSTMHGSDLSYIDGTNPPIATGDDIPLCYFVLPGRTNLGWNNNLLENNYSELQNVLINVKVLTAYFKLNAIDISSLDFTIPIYLNVQHNDKQINGYFYLNKVSNFISGRLTQCEQIRL